MVAAKSAASNVYKGLFTSKEQRKEQVTRTLTLTLTLNLTLNLTLTLARLYGASIVYICVYMYSVRVSP